MMEVRPFSERILPAPKNGGFEMEGYRIWCPTVIKGEDGKYHLFPSRWPIHVNSNWLTNSEIVHAVSPNPEGPYTYVGIALGARGRGFWDGRMTHNPAIHKHGDTYLLYYIGTTYSGETPGGDIPLTAELNYEARKNQRIGLATSKSVYGPWERRDEPILSPREGKWDSWMTCNPAVCVHEDGSVLMIYKAVAHHKDLLRLGVARARHYAGPFERVRDEPLFRELDATGDHLEDAYIWRSGKGYEMIMKDMAGGVCGEKGGGVHACSENGADWLICDPAKAYSKTVLWEDGIRTEYLNLERPQLLIENGRLRYLFLGAKSPTNCPPLVTSKAVCIPLKNLG